MSSLRKTFAFVMAAACLYGQHTEPARVMPRLIRYAGTFRPADGSPISPVESVTLAIYAEQRGGIPVWSETQNANLDTAGGFEVLIGAAQPEGISPVLFAGDAPRWLGVHFNRAGEIEQPRILLVSVPYALKAEDADKLGGRPASDYQLTTAGGGSCSVETEPNDVKVGTEMKSNKPTPHTTSGGAGYIAQFVNSTDLGNSGIFQSGGGWVGIGTSLPGSTLDVQSPAAGFATLLNVRQTNSTGVGATGMTLSNQNSTMLMRAYTPGAPGLLANSIGWFALNGSNKLLIGHAGASTGNDVGFFTNNSWASPQILLTNAGNVGIGTNSPQWKLDIAGDVNISGLLRLNGVPAIQVGLTSGNTVTGHWALSQNSTGTNNSGFGFNVLSYNTAGNQNTAVGGYALYSNTTGSYNVANGYGALQTNTAGSFSTAVGYNALAASNGAGLNTAVGAFSLNSNTSGQENFAGGHGALSGNLNGNQNTAAGSYALQANTTGSNNTAAGYYALYNSTGNNNIGIGFQAGYFVMGGHSNNIHIGNLGISADDGVIRIGTAGTQNSVFLAGVRGITTGRNDAIPVVIDSNGQLGTVSSSRRFKDDIQDMGDRSRDLMRLRPVTFRYIKPYADGSRPIQYGLIAEEVAEVYPDLIARSNDGQIETVKYQVLDSLLLNEVQRQETEIQRQKAELLTQKHRLDMLEQQNRELLERLARIEEMTGHGSR